MTESIVTDRVCSLRSVITWSEEENI